MRTSKLLWTALGMALVAIPAMWTSPAALADQEDQDQQSYESRFDDDDDSQDNDRARADREQRMRAQRNRQHAAESDRRDASQRHASPRSPFDRSQQEWDKHQDSDFQHQPPHRYGQSEMRGRHAGLGVMLNEDDESVTVRSVLPDSPAESAGIEPGDEIVRVDGERISSAEQLREEIQEKNPGTRVKLQIRRDGQPQRLEARLFGFRRGGAQYLAERAGWTQDPSDSQADHDSQDALAREVRQLRRQVNQLQQQMRQLQSEHERAQPRRMGARGERTRSLFENPQDHDEPSSLPERD